jgi:hypothetical protein
LFLRRKTWPLLAANQSHPDWLYQSGHPGFYATKLCPSVDCLARLPLKFPSIINLYYYDFSQNEIIAEIESKFSNVISLASILIFAFSSINRISSTIKNESNNPDENNAVSGSIEELSTPDCVI